MKVKKLQLAAAGSGPALFRRPKTVFTPFLGPSSFGPVTHFRTHVCFTRKVQSFFLTVTKTLDTSFAHNVIVIDTSYCTGKTAS